jgi:hypothetical protein
VGAAAAWAACGPLRSTSAELVGHLGPFLSSPASGGALSQVFSLLYNDLTHADKAVSGAAARSMRRLCQSCGAQLGEPVLALYEQVTAFPRGHLDRKDELALLAGLSTVANQLPSFDAVARAAERMVAPVQQRLAASVAAIQAGAAQGAAQGAAAASDQRREVQTTIWTTCGRLALSCGPHW